MLTDLEVYDNTEGVTDKAVDDAKDHFKAHVPYFFRDAVEGPGNKVVFSAHFIEMFRSAQSTECMDQMSKCEKYLYWDYLTYSQIVFDVMTDNPGFDDDQVDAEALIQYNAATTNGTPEVVVRTLSDYEAAEVYDLESDSCFDYHHVWEE